jgi:plasmid stabilization system protein ParE
VENYEVIWSLRAVNELDAIGEYIARDRPAAARRVIAALCARVGQLAQFPFSGSRFRRTRTGLYREIGYK